MTQAAPSKLKALFHISKGGSFYGLGMIADRLIAMATILLLTRLLSPADYGLATLCGTLTRFVVILCLVGQDAGAGLVFFDRQGDAWRRYLGNALTISLIAAFVVTGSLATIGKPLLTTFLPEVPFRPYILLALLTAFFGIAYPMAQTLLRAKQKALGYSIFTTAQALLNLLLVYFFVAKLGKGALGVVGSSLLVAVVFSVASLVLLRRDFRLGLDRQNARAALYVGSPFLVHALAATLLSEVDKIFVGAYRDLTEVGNFSVATSLVNMVTYFATAVNYAWGPYFLDRAGKEKTAASEFLSHLSTYYVVLIWSAAFGMLLFHREVLILFATKKFSDAAPIMAPLVASACLNALYFRLADPLFASKKTLAVVAATSTAAIVNTAMKFWSVPAYGVYGAAWSSFAANVLLCFLVYRFGRKAYPVRFEWSRIFRFFAVCAVLYLVTQSAAVSAVYWHSLVARFAACLLFPVFLFASGFFKPEEILYVRTQIARLRK